jgi:uncharacterized lipoprotein YddW (UPF0748 family)
MKRLKQKFSRALVLLLGACLLLTSCSEDLPVGESSAPAEEYPGYNGVFSVTLDGKEFSVTHLNCPPTEESVVLYTKAYENEGTPVLTLSGTYTGRTAITVRAETEGGITEYSVSSIDEDTFDGLPIPHNGFVLTLPTASLEGLRIRSGMAVPVAGDDVLGGLERMDVGTFRPNNEYRNILKRRISFADPVAGVSAEGIYYLSAEYTKNAIPLPAGSAVAVLQDGKVASVAVGESSAAGETQLVFVGAYNAAYATTFLTAGTSVTLYDLEQVSSYSDTEAVVIGEKIYSVQEGGYNNDRITESGVYVYDMNGESLSTPESDVDRIDVIILNDVVTYINQKNTRSMLPLAGGVAVTFAGDMVSVAESLTVGTEIISVLVDTAILPQNHVRIGSVAYDIQKFNTIRAPEGVSLLYTPEFGATTQTNPYGVEIAIADGVVVAVEIGLGDIEIPAGGYVLSIHKDHPLYKSACSVKKGDAARVSLGEQNYNVTSLTVNGINVTRQADFLVVYRNKATTGSNEYGYEILVDKDGIMVGDSYSGNAAIPQGGYVLSGHGTNKTALENAYCYGAKVFFDEKSMRITTVSTPETLFIDAAVRLDEIKSRLENAKLTLAYLDYNGLDGMISDVSATLSDAKEAFGNCLYDEALAKLSAVDNAWDTLLYSLIEAHPVENRAVWYRSAEKSDEQVREVVEKMKLLGINTIYLETWYNGSFTGFSDNDLIKHCTYNGSYDALEGFVRICHENGIEVHAWVQNFFIGTVEAQEQANMALAQYFPDWLKDKNGKNTYFYSASNTNFIFLNPYDKEVRTFLIDFYKEMITKYDIDGIHLDYIRFPELNYGSVDFGYNENIVSAWQMENNTTVNPAKLTAGAQYQSWVKFRQEIINSFVKEVFEMVKTTDPDTWLSAAVYPGIPTIKNDIFQDCENWVQNGYMDELFSMSYGADNAYVASNASKFAALAGDDCFYSTGISAFGETVPMNFALQMTEVREAGADGVAIFSLANIDASDYLYPVTEGAFRNPSVQTDKLNLTVTAQLEYVLDKAKNVYMPYAGLTEEKYQTFVSLLTPILEDAKAFDLANASYSQQKNYCVTTIKALSKAMTEVKALFDDPDHGKIAAEDLQELISWLTKSQNRIEARLS